jgi:hypothetical protein
MDMKCERFANTNTHRLVSIFSNIPETSIAWMRGALNDGRSGLCQ